MKRSPASSMAAAKQHCSEQQEISPYDADLASGIVPPTGPSGTGPGLTGKVKTGERGSRHEPGFSCRIGYLSAVTAPSR
jgi:hypothetical protein